MAVRRSSCRAIDPPSRLLDCTSECSLKQHSDVTLSSAFLGNIKLLQHCTSLCANPFRIVDPLGRNVLHVASSMGHLKMVRWLLVKKKVKIDVTDFESNWSALHRSIYSGQLGVGAYLVKCGADIGLRDKDLLTPLSLLNEDRKLFKSQLSVSSTHVYTWGRNSNVSLGHDHSRNYPERLDIPLDLIITQVILCKFHSVFLTEDGKVLTCGHGRGGRLGHDSEQSAIAPCVVKAMQDHCCVAIAAARDHTVILTKSGAVFTCGLNDAHQLGHGTSLSNVPSYYLSPKPVKTLKNKRVIAIGVGRFHTAMSTATEIYTVGKNFGQLGYEKNYDTQISPHAVAGINLDQDDIIQMSVSDAATACLTRRGRIFVCTDFTVKSIRCSFLEKSSCIQFTVCASLHDKDFLRKVETEPTKILMLDSEHQIWYWEPTKKGSIPSILPGLARHKVTQFSLGKSLTLVTDLGEVYKGSGSLSKPLQLQRMMNIQNAKAVFTDFKAINFTYIQHIYQPLFQPVLTPPTLSGDLAALLEDACLPGSISDIELEVGGQVFPAHKFILASASQKLFNILQSPTPPAINGGSVQPLQTPQLPLKCDNPSIFEAFLYYIYGSHIRILRPKMNGFTGHHHHNTSSQQGLGNGAPGTDSTGSLEGESTPDTSFASVDENDLTAEYDRFARIDPLDDFEMPDQIPQMICKSTPKKKTVPEVLKKKERSIVYHMKNSFEHQRELQLVDARADLKNLQELAIKFGLSQLKDGVDSLLSSLSIKNDIHKTATLVRPKLDLKCQSQFSDLLLLSQEGKGIPCHRCVLVARSDYFRSMLLMGWRESSEGTKSLSLPVSYGVLKAVIDFIYTDRCPSVVVSNSVEFVTSVLVIADQLLLTRLKDLCEAFLANSLDLRNAVDLLEFSEAYCAEQLKKSCLQFICVNAACFLEGRYLDGLDISLLDELSATYLSLVPRIEKRITKFPVPDHNMLPESYFMDDTPADDEVDSDNEFTTHNGTFNRTREDSESFSSPLFQETVSPRANTSSSSSSSRRRRRRKNSQSESRKQSHPSATPTSPPPSCVSPPGVVPSKPSEDGQTPNTSLNLSHNDSIENRGMTPMTPLSAEGRKECARSNSIKGSPKTKLLNKFALIASEENSTTTPLMNGVKNGSSLEELTNKPQTWQTLPSKQTSPPPHPGGSSPWTSFQKSVNPSFTGTSFREIMAKEEQESQQRERQNKRKSPPPANKTSQPSSSPSHAVSVKRSSTAPVTVPVRRQSSCDNVVVSPLPSTAQSPPVNPWKTNSVPLGTSPSVSMRELMAEAEAEEKKQRQHKHQIKMVSTRRPSEERPGRRQPASIPHQQVSFAAIVKSQELEEDRQQMAVNKPLPLIQIEERAILELEALYSSADNPDEYITVKRYRKKSKSSQSHSPVYNRQDSPWGV